MVCLLAGLVLFAAPLSARAQATKSWAVATDGLWSDPSKWVPAGVPGVNDLVDIGVGGGSYTVTLQGAVLVAKLTIGNTATLVVNGNPLKGNALLRAANGITNAGTLRLESSGGTQASSILLTGGALVNTGTLVVNAGSGGQRLITADLTNQGQVQISAPLTFNKSSGVYLNTGTWTIAAGQTLSITGGNQAFNQNGGILQADGELALRSATFSFNSGVIQGSGAVLTAATLNIAPAAGAGLLTLRGTCTLNGNVSAAQTLWVNGSPTGGSGYLRATTGFTNAGIIRLQSTGGVYASNILLTSGGIVNTGTIEVNTGSGGQRQLTTATLDNQGILAINAPTVFTKPSGVYTNSGALNVAAGQTLSIASGLQVFNQNGGTLDAQGELRLTAVPFNYNGGEVTGSGLILTSSPLNLGALAGAGAFTLRGACNLSGNVASNQVLWVRGSLAGGHSLLRIGGNVTNEGLIRFESTDGIYTANLTATTPTATLTNKGVIEVNQGSGGQRLIGADLDNQGTVNFNAPTLLNKSYGRYTNSGAMNIAAGRTLTINGGYQVFTQNGGTLAIGGAFLGSGISFNFYGGAITGNQPALKAVTLTLGPASGPVELVLQGASLLKSDVRPDQTLWVKGSLAGLNALLRADVGFTNAGTIRLESTEGLYTANILVTSGTLVNTGLIAVNAGSGGQRLIMANLDNQGRFEVNTPATFSKSSGVYTNTSEFIVAPGGSLSISGGLQVFNQNDGVLQAAGEVKLMGMTFNFNGGAIEGSGMLPTSITLNLGPASGGAAFTLRGSCLLGGNVGLGQVLWVNGNPVGGAGLLRSLAGFTNRGTIRLESSGGALASNLLVVSGLLVNQGRIEVHAGSGGQRLITADLDNQGTFVSNAQLQFNKSRGVYTNSGGEFRVEAGQVLTIASGLQVFNQNGGDLVVDGDMNLSSMTFNINGGSVPNKAPLLYNCALNFGTSGAAAGVANLKVRGRCTLNGNVAAGQTVWVNGTAATDAVLTAANGLTNRGTIRLESSDSPVASNLVVTNGTLVNEGTIAANKGSGGGRSLLTNLENRGLLEINTRSVLSKSANGVFANSGTIDIVPGDSLTISVGSFTNTEPGRVSGGGELILSRLNVSGTGTLAANVESHQTSLSPGLGGAGILRIEGSYLQSPTSELQVQLGGLVPGTEHDQLQVTGSVAIDGKLRVSVINDYRPNPCDAFAVFTYAARNGHFSPVEGLNLGGDRVLRPNYGSTGLDLLARSPLAKVNFIPTALNAAESGGSHTYQVCLTEQPNAAVVVGALPDAQVRVAPPELTFAASAWGVVQSFAATAVDDPVYEQAHSGRIDHTLRSADARFDGAAAGSIAVQIEDNDTQPTLSIADLSLNEGNAGERVAAFVVTLSNPSAAAVQAGFSTTDGNAQAGNDYLAGSGAVTFAPLETSNTLSVMVQGEQVYEGDETFLVNLHDAVNGTIADGQGIGTIVNDDAQPALSIGDVSVSEGNGGVSVISFPVTLSNPSSQALDVEYLTADGSALAGSDYVADAGRVSFGPLESSKTLSVVVQGEQVYEGDETFSVNLANPVNGVIADGQGLGTILNDDPLPSLSIGDVSVGEGDAGVVVATFPVTISNPSSQSLNVEYLTADGSAQAGSDYLAGTGNLVFGPLETSKTVSVVVQGEQVYEGDENFSVNLANAANALIADGQGTGTITDDDPLPTVSIADASAVEGNLGQVGAGFVLTLSNPSGQALSVGYTTADGSALAGSDYLADAGRVSFEPLETSKTLVVQVAGDLLNETAETFLVDLRDPVNGTIADGQGTGTITDDDPQPALSISDVAVVEGTGGTVQAVFTVSLSAPSGQAVRVNFATADGSARAGSDYGLANGTLHFAPLETSKAVAIEIEEDLLDEADETFLVDLSGPVNATLADAQGTATITDDDAPPALSISDVAVAEGNHGAQVVLFTVSLSVLSGQAVSVNVAAEDGSAQAGSDYVAASAILTIPAGQTSETIGITVNGDVLNEADETFRVRLSNPVNATLADAEGLGTITNDDVPAAVGIADVSVAEGNSGTQVAVFTVNLSAPSGVAVLVDYTTASGSAAAGIDYVAASGTLTFAAGEISKTINIAVVGDQLDEADETFLIDLGNVVNGTLVDAQAVGTITDDDAPPSLNIGDVSVVEGNSGTKRLVFSLNLSAASGQAVSASYVTADGTADNSDYVPARGVASFAPGETSAAVVILVNGDVFNEADETFLVNLGNPVNTTLADAQGVGTITNDDVLPGLSISDVSVIEGHSGAKRAVFKVEMSAVSGQPVSVGWATADGSALAGSDYEAASGTLVFTLGETSKTISIAVNGDLVNEVDETFLVNLSGPVNATLADAQGVGIITNDDVAPALSVGDATEVEGNSGTKQLVFKVSLSAVSGQAVSVGWATADRSAQAGSDYAAASGTLTFSLGEISKTLSITLNGDLLNEANETLLVNLTNAVNATLADAQGVGTITNDDAAPALNISDAAEIEGNSGTKQLTFKVNLSAASGQAVSVGWATADSTALAGSDYVAANGTVGFNPGETSKTVAVTINGDLVSEANEVFAVNLVNAVNATLADARGVGTITNDDVVVTLSIGDAVELEGNSGTKQLVFKVNLSAPSGLTVKVQYATLDLSALAGIDYLEQNGTLSFAAGELSKIISVPLKGDLLHETDETFAVNLTNAVNATIADAQGLGTITNDDAAPALSIADASTSEGHSGAKQMVFTVALSAPGGLAVSVQYATANISALAGSDYVATSGALSFAAGEVSKTFSVAINGDLVNESNETFAVNLSAPANATIADGQGVGTITNDDVAVSVSIGDAAVSEGHSGTKQLVFAVNLSAASGQAVGVGWATANGTALAGSDYVVASGTLNFAAGETSKTIGITVKGDLANEPNETFAVNLSAPVNATIADGQGIGTILTDDHAPDVSLAAPSATHLWPPNHKMVNIQIIGLSDADNDPLTVKITQITQDESVYGSGSGKKTGPDGAGIGTAVAKVRAEREGKGNGRVYVVSFTVTDGHEGGLVAGAVRVCVPRDQGDDDGDDDDGDECVDDGQRYDSVTGGLIGAAAKVAADLSGGSEGFGVGNYPNPFNPATTIVYTLAEQAPVRLAIYNMLGQQIKVLVEDVQGPGSYGMEWDSTDELGYEVGAGIYFYRLEAGPRVATGKMLLVR